MDDERSASKADTTTDDQRSMSMADTLNEKREMSNTDTTMDESKSSVPTWTETKVQDDYSDLPWQWQVLREMKGSLMLRSNHMDYCKSTLVYNWHEARQADPKDYDVTLFPLCKDLRKSAYKRLGNMGEDDWKTTTNEQLSQIRLKKDYTQKDLPKHLVIESNKESAITERETGYPERGFGAVLPRHSPDHGKMYTNTTYSDAFNFDFVPSEERRQDPDPPTVSAACKKCHSQFTNTADYRRCGINTWQDESGVYANRELKQAVMKQTNSELPCI